jgi:hypothetical protein
MHNAHEKGGSMRTGTLILGMTLSMVSCGAFAQVTEIARYHLGEADPGAAPGAPGAATTTDSAGAFDLTIVGAPTYSPTSSPISPLAMAFAGADGYRFATPVSVLTDNFGIEAWVFSTSTAGNAVIAYNGNTGASGWGLFRSGGTYAYLYGGVVFGGSSPVQLNTWTHLALVRDSGVTTFYVNGRVNDTNGGGPNPPAGGFGVGINPTVAQEFMNGSIDEVRVFTFAPGTFTPAALLLPSPSKVPASSPATLLLLALALALAGAVVLRRRAT